MKQLLVWLKQPAVWLTATLMCVICIWDFSQRVYAPIDSDVSVLQADSVQVFSIAPKTMRTAAMERWIQRNQRVEPVIQVDDEGSEQDAELAGAELLGSMQVRVRATFANVSANRRFAIVEYLTEAERIMQSIRLEQNDKLGDFTVIAVNASSVIFAQDDDIYEISVFAWYPERIDRAPTSSSTRERADEESF